MCNKCVFLSLFFCNYIRWPIEPKFSESFFLNDTLRNTSKNACTDPWQLPNKSSAFKGDFKLQGVHYFKEGHCNVYQHFVLWDAELILHLRWPATPHHLNIISQIVCKLTADILFKAQSLKFVLWWFGGRVLHSLYWLNQTKSLLCSLVRLALGIIVVPKKNPIAMLKAVDTIGNYSK